MGPASTVGHILHLVVPGIAIRHKTPSEPIEEALGAFSTAVGLVLKEPNLVPEKRGAGIQPHPGFRGRRLSIFFQYLHDGLIRMNHRLGQKLLLHGLVQRL